MKLFELLLQQLVASMTDWVVSKALQWVEFILAIAP